MKKINDIFIGQHFCLPNNFLTSNYDTFLFFDFGLGMEPEFLEYFSDLLDLGGFNKQVNVFDWVAVQDIPVNWGVFAFQSSKKESIRLFHMMNRDWFVDIERFKSMEKVLIREFGEEFINILLSNYGNIRSKQA